MRECPRISLWGLLVISLGVSIVCLLLLLSRPPRAEAVSERVELEQFACSPTLTARDRRLLHDKLTIAEMNVEWLFLDGGRGNVRCPGQGCPWKNDTMAQQHLERVATSLASLDADLIHLVEIENCDTLNRLISLMETKQTFLNRPAGQYRAFLVPGTDTATGQNVALLSRVDPVWIQRSNEKVAYPIQNSQCPKSNKKPRSTTLSKHYLAIFDIALPPKQEPSASSSESGSATLRLFFAGVHFLARPLDRSRCHQREAQATIIRHFIDEKRDAAIAGPGLMQASVVLGDMNDYDPTVPGADKGVPISGTLSLLKGDALTNILAHVPIAFRYSVWHDTNHDCLDPPHSSQEHSLIDHALLSANLLPALTSVHIWNPRALAFYKGIPEDTISCQNRTSDHFPSVFTLDLTKLEPDR